MHGKQNIKKSNASFPASSSPCQVIFADILGVFLILSTAMQVSDRQTGYGYDHFL
jgi:hypothetical protein